jgi:cysteinyl-tRNA synthetase
MKKIPIVRVALPAFNIRPISYPADITANTVNHLLYQRLYHKLVEKDYGKADTIRDVLLKYVEIMDIPEGTEWMWKPVIPMDH